MSLTSAVFINGITSALKVIHNRLNSLVSVVMNERIYLVFLFKGQNSMCNN